MVARIITVAQQKGGAGKTTLAIHLAIHWAERGRRVALLDIDPQGSLIAWWRGRQGGGDLPLDCQAVSGWRVSNEIERLKRANDIVLVDSPPHAATEAKLAIRAADLVLMPVQLSPMDFWATRPTLQLAVAEKRPILMVLNRVAPRGSGQDRIRAQIEAADLPVARASLGNRAAFAASLLEGRGVTEHEPASSAALEIRALADELEERLAGM
ncbi:MAG: ParA family protein [Alphaproteobacteria bacterium]|nr:ParA family protein [Alphaproteobacteria bacterium]